MVKNPTANAGAKGRHRFDPWVGKIPWRSKWQSCLVFLPGEVHGQRSLVVYSPEGSKESDTIEQVHMDLGYRPWVAQILSLWIWTCSTEGKKSPSTKNVVSGHHDLRLSPPSHTFSKEQDLAGAFLHKCKYNYYLCISIHPQVVKDNTTALTITIPPFSCPAELQMLLH